MCSKVCPAHRRTTWTLLNGLLLHNNSHNVCCYACQAWCVVTGHWAACLPKMKGYAVKLMQQRKPSSSTPRWPCLSNFSLFFSCSSMQSWNVHILIAATYTCKLALAHQSCCCWEMMSFCFPWQNWPTHSCRTDITSVNSGIYSSQITACSCHDSTCVLCLSTTHGGGRQGQAMFAGIKHFVLDDQMILALLGCSCMCNCNCSYALASGSWFNHSIASHSTAYCTIFGVFGT